MKGSNGLDKVWAGLTVLYLCKLSIDRLAHHIITPTGGESTIPPDTLVGGRRSRRRPSISNILDPEARHHQTTPRMCASRCAATLMDLICSKIIVRSKLKVQGWDYCFGDITRECLSSCADQLLLHFHLDFLDF